MKKFYYLLISARPHQWVKNFFVFLPLIFGEKLLNWNALVRVALTFILFSLTASATYLLNDIKDCKKDRRHPRKSQRPIAAGKLSPTLAIFTSLITYGLVWSIAWFFSPKLLAVILVYILLNTAYSHLLKKLPLIDVFLIALFFILRLIAGAVVIGVRLTPWIVLCTFFLALLVSLSKRYYELKAVGGKAPEHRRVLRFYSLTSLRRGAEVNLFLLLFTYLLYSFRAFLRGKEGVLLTLPVVFWGSFHYLDFFNQKMEDRDPVEMVLSDPVILTIAFLWFFLVFIALYLL